MSVFYQKRPRKAVLSNCNECICLSCTRLQCPYKGGRCLPCQRDNLQRILDCDYFFNYRTVRVFRVVKRRRKGVDLVKRLERFLDTVEGTQITWDSFTVCYGHSFITTLQSIQAVREYMDKFSEDFRKKLSIYDSTGREVILL